MRVDIWRVEVCAEQIYSRVQGLGFRDTRANSGTLNPKPFWSTCRSKRSPARARIFGRMAGLRDGNGQVEDGEGFEPQKPTVLQCALKNSL